MPGARSLRARTSAKRSSPVPADVQRVTQLAGEGALPLGATAGEPELLDEESGQAGGVIEREAVLVRNVGIGHKGEQLLGRRLRLRVPGLGAKDLDHLRRLVPIALAHDDVVAGEVP